jgi:hypothetical protein
MAALGPRRDAGDEHEVLKITWVLGELIRRRFKIDLHVGFLKMV